MLLSAHLYFSPFKMQSPLEWRVNNLNCYSSFMYKNRPWKAIWILISPRIKLAGQERIITLQTSRWNLKGYKYFLTFYLNIWLFSGDKYSLNLLFKQYCILIEYCAIWASLSSLLSYTHYFTSNPAFPGLLSICHVLIPLEFPTSHPRREHVYCGGKRGISWCFSLFVLDVC